MAEPVAPLAAIFLVLVYRAELANCLTALSTISLLDLPEAETRAELVPLVVVFTALLKKLELDRLVSE